MPVYPFDVEQLASRLSCKALHPNRILLHEASGLEASFYDNEGTYNCDIGFSWDNEEAFESEPARSLDGALFDALTQMRQAGEVFERLADIVCDATIYKG